MCITVDDSGVGLHRYSKSACASHMGMIEEARTRDADFARELVDKQANTSLMGKLSDIAAVARPEGLTLPTSCDRGLTVSPLSSSLVDVAMATRDKYLVGEVMHPFPACPRLYACALLTRRWGGAHRAGAAVHDAQ